MESQQELLKQKIATLQQKAAALYGVLPAAVKAKAKMKHHAVHPFLELAEEHPELPAVRELADVLLALTEAKVALTMAEVERKGPPDLSLVRQRKWRDA